MQHWFSRTTDPLARDPYFLYVASNLGSMSVMFAYPFLFEPLLRISQQISYWAVAYMVLFGLIVLCALITQLNKRSAPESKVRDTVLKKLSNWNRFAVLSYTIIPSSLLLGVTSYLTTNIANVPLFWMVPLGLYLLTFIIAFSNVKSIFQNIHNFVYAAAIITSLILLILPKVALPTYLIVLLHLSAFFIIALKCHREVVLLRPATSDLGEFYLWLALGGVLGGIFNALLSPMLFTHLFEYPLMLCLATLVLIRKRLRLALIPTASFLMCLVFIIDNSPLVLHSERNFFGTVEVVRTSDHRLNYLRHGKMIHGLEIPELSGKGNPAEYYGPITEIFAAARKNTHELNIGVAGLGAGILACHANSSDMLRFYEINPTVVSIASNQAYFTFLHHCPPAAGIAVGDARILLQQEPDKGFDLLVIDVFSGDAIPTHMITKEALELYLTKLKPRGVIAINITNQRLDLEPIIKNVADSLRLHSLIRRNWTYVWNGSGFTSHWVMISKDKKDLALLDLNPNWQTLNNNGTKVVWSDDFSNIASAFRW